MLVRFGVSEGEFCGGRSASPLPQTCPPPVRLLFSFSRAAGTGGWGLSPSISAFPFPGSPGAAPALLMPPAPGSGSPALQPRPPRLLLLPSRALLRLLPGPTSAPPARARSPLRGLHNVKANTSEGSGGQGGALPRCPWLVFWRRRRDARGWTSGCWHLCFLGFSTSLAFAQSCSRLQWWGAGGARKLHLFWPGLGLEATPRAPSNVPGSLIWVPSAPD